MLSNYDKRQIILLKKHLNFIKEGSIFFGNFEGRVEGILTATQEVDANWKQAIYEHWAQLDTIFACALNSPDRPIHPIDIKMQTIPSSK